MMNTSIVTPPGTQGIRMQRVHHKDADKPAPKLIARHDGLLQDQVCRSQRGPWCPSFSLAVRFLLLIRVAGAMYANISDCDEVYNYWEPLHYLDRGYGFQTWETSPRYAIRSWAYVLLHLFPPKWGVWFLGLEKRAMFFAVRMMLAVISSLCEAKVYRAVIEKINFRVGRYFFFMLLFSAGMWNASTAFLPSSFAMYANMIAFAYAMGPPSMQDNPRTLLSTLAFAAGAIVGWPFSLALAIPFVIEELFIRGADRVKPGKKSSWMFARSVRLVNAGLISALLFIPVVGIDSFIYGRLAIVPWNIIKYNIFGESDRGPDLYGTEPWTFYFFNLLLNFNICTLLAIAALPALVLTYFVDYRRVGGPLKSDSTPDREKDKELGARSSPYTLLAIRLLPFYIWLGILTAESHKEERFFFPAYPFLTFNAAVTLYLARGWLEVVYVRATRSPYRASRTKLFRLMTLSVMLCASVLGISRALALNYYYHAPLEIMHEFETKELVRVLNVTGLLPPPPPPPSRTTHKQLEEPPEYDLSNVVLLNLTLCYGKEWHRFLSHFLVHDGVNVEFIRSEFRGLLPRHFGRSKGNLGQLWKWDGTRTVPEDLNDLNIEDPRHYVDIKKCHYLVDLDFPLHRRTSKFEPRYVQDKKHWERVHCARFLDAQNSPLLTRTLWLPGTWWQRKNEFGEYCLLKKKNWL